MCTDKYIQLEQHKKNIPLGAKPDSNIRMS